MKEKNLQPRLLYPVRNSFRFEDEISSFTDKKMLSSTKSVLKEILKELLEQETQENKKSSSTKTKP